MSLPREVAFELQEHAPSLGGRAANCRLLCDPVFVAELWPMNICTISAQIRCSVAMYHTFSLPACLSLFFVCLAYVWKAAMLSRATVDLAGQHILI